MMNFGQNHWFHIIADTSENCLINTVIIINKLISFANSDDAQYSIQKDCRKRKEYKLKMIPLPSTTFLSIQVITFQI
jgi:hypothetical protein